MAGILFTGTARNEVEQEFYAEIDASDGWTVRPEWSSMEELLNEQYGPSSSLAAPAMGYYTNNTAVRAVQFPDSYELVILRRDYDKEEPPPSEPDVSVFY